MKYNVKSRLTSFTGKASLGWYLGHGYIQETMTVKSERWCVVGPGNKSVAVCNSKSIADKIAELLNEA